jgi:tetratricopeptide (TPR) repeat protein
MLWSHLLAVVLAPPRCAVAQDAATGPAANTSIKEGQQYYEQSRFDEAISVLRSLIDRGQLAGEDLQRAREFLARSYVKKGYAAQAKDTFKEILSQNPAYRPDPVRVPPDETAVFEQALKEFAAPPPPPTPPPSTPPPPAAPPPKKPLWSKWWVWVAGAAVVGGVAAAAGGGGGGGGGEKDQPLGSFPNPPAR